MAAQYLFGRGEVGSVCCTDEGVFFISKSQIIQLGKVVNADEIYNTVIKNLHQGEKNTPQQDRLIITEQYSQLREAIKEGAGNLVTKFEYGTPNQTMLKNLQTNVASFSAFKKHDMMKELVKELKDDNGNLKSFAEYKKTALPLVGKYREEWLQNEYDAAVRGSRMATQWQRFQDDKDLYPNLIYTLSRSANLREDHKALVGTILPIDDPFWDVHTPPNGWGCKCGISNTREAVTGAKGAIVVDKMFAFNPGKEGQVFDIKKHPYAQLPQKEYGEALKAARGAMCKYEGKVFLKNDGEKLKSKSVPISKLKEPVQFNRESFNHNLQISDYFLDRLTILKNIEEHLQEATYIMSEKNLKPKEKPYVKKYHYLKMKDKQANFLLEERTSGEVFFYMIKLTGDT